MPRWLLYGASGFTGNLLAAEAVRRGHRPVLAGRAAEKLAPIAEALQLEQVVFSLDHLDRVVRAIREFDLVFHAAGPFIDTADSMMRACALVGAHYLDITGEIPVFEASYAYDEAVRQQNRAIICGAGFDIIPTNCLAQYVAAQMPEAAHLEIAIQGLTKISSGTARTAIAAGASGGWIRRNGKLIPYPLGAGVRRVVFPSGEQTAVPIPWGDLAASYRSTGVPNITTYWVLPAYAAAIARLGAPVGQFLLSIPPVRDVLSRAARLVFQGPDDTQRKAIQAFVWAQATDEAGNWVQAWLCTPEPYLFTALAGIRAVERTLAENPTGVLTPAQAFGADFPLDIEGVSRLDKLVSG